MALKLRNLILVLAELVAPLSSLEEESSIRAKPAPSQGSNLVVTFQNENLVAEMQDTNLGSKQLLAVAPDLIVVLDSQSGSSLGTHEYRYGVNYDFFNY